MGCDQSKPSNAVASNQNTTMAASAAPAAKQQTPKQAKTEDKSATKTEDKTASKTEDKSATKTEDKSGDQDADANKPKRVSSKRSSKRMSSKRKSSSSKAVVDYDKLKQALLDLMEDENWDDGSYGPLFIRMAWHSSGTYDKSDNSGGSNGATMRFSPEKDDPENAGLAKGRKMLEPIKKQFPGVSYSDLWVFAAYVAIEATGGPHIPFRPGRKDKTAKDAVKPGRLPAAEKGIEKGEDEQGRAKGWENLAEHIRGVFTRMGFSDYEIVALMSGGHVYGRCHKEHSGYSGAWVEEPTKFSNEYAADLIEDEWIRVDHDTKIEGVPVPDEVRPAKGKTQYMGKWSPSEEKEELEELETPDSSEFKLGRYKVVDDWINCRASLKPDSPIIAQPKEGEEFDVLAIQVSSTAVRARLDVGGWCSIVSSKGDPLMERVGDLKLEPGKHRVVKGGGAKAELFDGEVTDESAATGKLKNGQEVQLTDFKTTDSGDMFAKIDESENAAIHGKSVRVVSASHGPLFDRIVEGYNEVERKPIKGRLQVKHQMMLVADMVMLWDDDFKKHLEVFAEDEDKLKEEFGKAYKKLTELGMDD